MEEYSERDENRTRIARIQRGRVRSAACSQQTSTHYVLECDGSRVTFVLGTTINMFTNKCGDFTIMIHYRAYMQ